MWWWTVDRMLLGAVLALIGLGMVLSFGSSPAAAARIGIHDPFHFAIRQCAFGGGAAVLLVAVSMLSPRGARRLAFFVYLASIAVMVAITLPHVGHSAKGAGRWLAIGGFSLQPSEFMKPALIVLAAWMFSEARKDERVPGVFIAFAMYAVAVLLLLLQPDVGQTVLITVAFVASFFMAGMPLRWILTLGGLASAGFVGIYFAFAHVAARFHKFLSPEKADTHQVDKAAEAIAHGGLFGTGPGEGIMKRHVPDLHTDFIYSVAAEEYGLLFSLGLITVFAVVVVRGLYKAMKISDTFEQVAAGGLFVLVGQQTLINVAVNLNVIPTKGMTLPFISYGGSSVLAMGLTLGLALALTRKKPGGYASDAGFGASSPAES
jgi:cell division protein FtsW